MGTSAARKAPRGRGWRQAKAAASRYLAPDGGQAVAAGEVVRRYLLAVAGAVPTLEGGLAAAFGLTRRVAQDLGHFWQHNPKGTVTKEAATLEAHVLAQRWLPPAGDLEWAAARTALVAVLQEHLAAGAGGREIPGAAEVVRDFLARTVSLRLYLDLGEALEAAAWGAADLQAGQEAFTQAAAQGLAVSASPEPENWLQFPGWLWVSRSLAGLLTISEAKSGP